MTTSPTIAGRPGPIRAAGLQHLRENPVTDAPNICWHDDEATQRHCHHSDIDDRDLITWGRCRAGQRWFWAASVFLEDVSAHGWADTEEDAIEAARAVVEGFAADRPAIAVQMHGHASHVLKDVNAAKRAQRPAKGDGDAVQREFLYGIYHGGEESDPHVDSFPITKKTAKRIYYVRGERWNRDRTAQVPDIGYVDRQELEEKGEVRNRGVHWCRPDSTLYAEPPKLGQHRQEQPDLGELKTQMAAAHPDRGGTDAEFIAARERYERARRRAKTTV